MIEIQQHKYLEEIIERKDVVQNWMLPDEREPRWSQQIQEYGFDDRETWNLDTSFYQWLYERLRMYKDIGGEVVDLNYHKFDVDGKELTQLQIIDRLLELLPKQIKSDVWEETDYCAEICDLWKTVLPSMWW